MSVGYARRTLEYLLESQEGTAPNTFGKDPAWVSEGLGYEVPLGH